MMRMRNRECNQGAGPTFVKRISKIAKRLFIACIEIFDHRPKGVDNVSGPARRAQNTAVTTNGKLVIVE
jgi:hypothetical protein